MTLLWFFVWLICNIIGDDEVLTFDPVNWWAGSFMFVVALGPRRHSCPQGGPPVALLADGRNPRFWRRPTFPLGMRVCGQVGSDDAYLERADTAARMAHIG